MHSNQLFSQWIKQRRRILDLTQAELADRIGCSISTLQKFEEGKRRPSKEMAELLAIHLEIPTAEHVDFLQAARGEETSVQLSAASNHNLPAPLTSFVDRTVELRVACEKVRSPTARLLTLVGPPGIGKTRLSLEVGQALLADFPDGIWFVALSSLTDPALLLPTLARVLNVSDSGAQPLAQRVKDRLRPHTALLLLDNFEHLLEAAPLVSDLLRACPHLKVIATSRERLQVYGEHIYPLPALALPPRAPHLTLAQVAQSDAVKLFLARATAAQPQLTLNTDNAQTIAEICQRLEGMPLAIELAAAQLTHFSLTALNDQLQSAPLQALTLATRDVEPRQRTLRNSLQWSYDLLTAAERSLFAQLGVFVGGFTTAAAQAVCPLADEESLLGLADRHLLRREADQRWSLLELVREFALEQLAIPVLRDARQRHAEYFTQHFAAITAATSDAGEFFKVVNNELPNARAALYWLLAQQNPLAGVLAATTAPAFSSHGLTLEGRRWLHDVLAAGLHLPLPIQHLLYFFASVFALHEGEFGQATAYAKQALTTAHALAEPAQMVEDLAMLVRIHLSIDDGITAKAFGLEAAQIAQDFANSATHVSALSHLSLAELQVGDMTEATLHCHTAYALLHDPSFHEQLYTSWTWSITCLCCGAIALNSGDHARARHYFCEGLQHSRYAVEKLWLLDPLAGAIGTQPTSRLDEIRSAAVLWGAVEALSAQIGLTPIPGFHRRNAPLIAAARSRIDPAEFAAAWAEGRKLSLDEVVALALRPA